MKYDDGNLNAIIENSYDGIYITDGQANTIMVNEAYEKITGLQRELMLGRNMAELVREAILSESASLAVLEKKRVVTLNQTFSTGARALVTSTPVFDEAGEIVLIVTNVRDMTELYALKSQLEKNEQLAERYKTELEKLQQKLQVEQNMIFIDENMRDIVDTATRVAETDISVILFGESGVGKEVIASHIHYASPRQDKPFIKLNCGALPENLIETELFGYEEGAFTGAKVTGKTGVFELADKGTLFLDEVGELPLNMQVKLLRVLQDYEITRVGGTKNIKVDVRIIAATNKNLKQMVREGSFRKDLYYRLNIVPIHIPPLRERPDDIPALMHAFIMNINNRYGWSKAIDRKAFDIMARHCWPGNIRELKNVVERLLVMTNKDLVEVSDLPQEIIDKRKKAIMKKQYEEQSLGEAVVQLEKYMIDQAYKKHGSVRAAAKALQIDPSTFIRKRKKFEQE